MRVRSGELDESESPQPLSCPMCNVAINKKNKRPASSLPAANNDDAQPLAVQNTGAELLQMNGQSAFDPPIDRPPQPIQPEQALLRPY